MRIIFVIALVVGSMSSALAQRVEYVTKVKASPTAGSKMRAIDSRHIVMSELLYHKDAHVDVLVVDTQKVIEVKTTRAMLAQRFGMPDPTFGVSVPEGELVLLDDKRAGLHLADSITAPTRRHWYAEIDPKTGGFVRSANLGTLDDKQTLYWLGTDAAQNAGWFYAERYGDVRQSDFGRTAGPTSIVVRRLDLKTLAISDAATVTLAARPMKNGYEDRLFAHAAPDFSRFAFVEYDEDAFKTKPPAKVYFVDPNSGKSFSVRALDTTYGVAFSRDGAYAFLASGQARKVVRVDLAKQKIDKTVVGPYVAHHAIVSPAGSRLFVLASSSRFTVYDLPSLGNRSEVEHPTGATSDAFGQLFGGGAASLDGRYFVLQEAIGPGPSVTVGLGPPKEFVIVRLVD